jgi:hypothetical protein
LWLNFLVYWNNLSQAWLQSNLAGWYEAQWGYSQPTFADAQAWLMEHDRTVYEQKFGNLTPAELEHWYRAQNTEWGNNMVSLYQNKTVAMFDVAFLMFDKVESTSWVEKFTGWPQTFIVFRYLIFPGPISIRWTILYRFLMLLSLLYFARSLFIIVTPLPNPDPSCKPVIHFPDNIWLEAYANLPLVWWYSETTCQDVLFSGHTCYGTLGTLMSIHYLQKGPWTKTYCFPFVVVDCMASVFMFWGWYVIAVSRFHYTVDVLFGVMMTFAVYVFYHTSQKSVWIPRQPGSRACVFSTLYAPALKWLTKHDKDVEYWKQTDLRIRHSHGREVCETESSRSSV